MALAPIPLRTALNVLDVPNRTGVAAMIETQLARTADLELTVGPTAEFADYNQALVEAARIRVGFKDRGTRIAIVAHPGFIVDRPTYIVQENFSYVTFEMAPGMTSIPVIREAFTEDNPFPGGGNNWRFGARPMFAAMRGAAFPYLAALYDYDNTGDGWGTVGLLLHENSMGVVARGGGFRNVGWRGCYWDASFLYAREIDVSGCGKAVRALDGSAGPEGTSGGLRASNGSRGLLRQVNARFCRDGGYFSDSLISISDADASDCTNVGWAAQAGAMVYGGAPKADRCGSAGYRVTAGGKMVLSESSNTDNVYASAQDCIGNAVVVDDGGDFFSNRGDFSSTSTHAVNVSGASQCRMPAANIKSLAGRAVSFAEGSFVDLFGATCEGTGDAAVRSFNGGWVNVANAKLGGSTPALKLSGGTVAVVSATTTALDGVTPYSCNVLPGEYSKDGQILGADSAVTVRSTDASFILTGSGSGPTILLTANLTQGRTCTTYYSTAYPNKRHLIIHGGSGSPLSIYQPAGVAPVNRIAALAPGEAVWIMPDGSGGWRVLTRFRRHIRRKQGDSSLTMTPAVGDYVAITDPLEADRKIIMYDPADGDARPHVITRLDAAPFNAVIRNLADTETIGTVSAGQFGVVAPHPDGTGWYIAMKGSRL